MGKLNKNNVQKGSKPNNLEIVQKHMCAWHVSSTPNCVFMADLLSSRALLKCKKKEKNKRGVAGNESAARRHHP